MFQNVQKLDLQERGLKMSATCENDSAHCITEDRINYFLLARVVKMR